VADANPTEFIDGLQGRLANITDTNEYDDDALEAFQAELRETAAAQQDAALEANDANAHAIIAACAEAFDQIAGEMTRRADERAASNDRTQQALAALGATPTDEDGPDGDTAAMGTARVTVEPVIDAAAARRVGAAIGAAVRDGVTAAVDLTQASDDELTAEIARRGAEEAVTTATDAGVDVTPDMEAAADAAAMSEAVDAITDVAEEAGAALAGGDVTDVTDATDGTTPPDTAMMAADAPTPEPTDMTEPMTNDQEATLSTEPTASDGIDLSGANLEPAAAAAALATVAGGDSPTLPTQPAPTTYGAFDGLYTTGRNWAVPNRLRPRRTVEASTASPVPFTDLGSLDINQKGEMFDGKHALAEAIAEKFDQVKGLDLLPVGMGKLKMARATAPDMINPLTGEPGRVSKSVDSITNMAILQAAGRQFQSDLMAVAASGGNCAIPTNIYDVFNAATVQNPVEGFLRAVSADRGGIRYLSAPNWADAQAGVQVTTDAEDADGYSNQTPPGPTTPKVCVHFDCPEELECIVDAVSACAEFGNLSYRTATELVEVLLDQLAVAHAQAKEITYLDAIQAGSTAVTGDSDDYGANRSIVWSLGNAVWAYRKRNHIGRSMPIDVLLPDTVIPILKADAVADLHLGMDFLGVDQETLAAELLNSMNVNVEFYYDYSSTYGPSNAMQNAQGPGNIGNWPVAFEGYIYAPGTWVRLDGGILDVGIVRDSTLNSQNNLQIFSEEWVQACKLGYESVAFTFDLCPSGVGPDPTTARPCSS
jgi:hypothetical protein